MKPSTVELVFALGACVLALSFFVPAFFGLRADMRRLKRRLAHEKAEHDTAIARLERLIASGESSFEEACRERAQAINNAEAAHGEIQRLEEQLQAGTYNLREMRDKACKERDQALNENLSFKVQVGAFGDALKGKDSEIEQLKKQLQSIQRKWAAKPAMKNQKRRKNAI